MVACLLLLSFSAYTQPTSYPGKPIRLLVPSQPGGSNDGVARILATGLNHYMGRPIVIDNRAGGGGIIASELAARARPDGYTLLFVYAAFTTMPFLQPNITYDTLRDFAPISEIADQAQFIAVNAALPVNSVQQLLALAKNKPGGLLAGYTQPGGSTHLATEIFKLRTGTSMSMTSVSYKGGAAVQIALAAGEVQIAFLTATSMLPQISTGKIKAIAVAAPAGAGRYATRHHQPRACRDSKNAQAEKHDRSPCCIGCGPCGQHARRIPREACA